MWTALNKPQSPLVLILDNVRSAQCRIDFPYADAFRIQEILLCGITATPPHKDIRKTALGATESVQWQYHDKTIDVIQNLQSKGIVVLAVEQAEGSKVCPISPLYLKPLTHWSLD